MADLEKEPTLDELIPTFEVGNSTYESSLQEDLFINRGDLNGEFIRHPTRYAFYATCYELASSKVEIHAVALKRLYAQLDHEKRTELMNSGVKATEKMVENSVITDDRYVELQEQLLEAQKQMGVLKAAMGAMQHRKDMLVQLGSAYRAEMQADVSLKANAAREVVGGNTR